MERAHLKINPNEKNQHFFKQGRSNRLFSLLVPFFASGFILIGLYGCEDVKISAATVQPFNPDVKWCGRVDALAVNPSNSDIILAASATGGVFETSSGGRRWLHKGGSRFWSYTLKDIEYCLDDSRYIIATTGKDLSSSPNGGIWRSGDRGLSFQRPATALPTPGARCTDQSSAYGIYVDPSNGLVYVGTDCGYAISQDNGASWSHHIVNSSLGVDGDKVQDRVLNIVASGRRLYALTKDGLYYSSDAGINWNPSNGILESGIRFTDATPRLAIAPDNPEVAFLALDDSVSDAADLDPDNEWTYLYVTFDGGANWEELRKEKDKARQGIVRVTRHKYKDQGSNGYSLYWGDGPNLRRAVVTNSNVDDIRNLWWDDVSVDHADINDIGFDYATGEPVILASDGGVHITENFGGEWKVSGGGHNGFNALQIYKVDGQQKFDGRTHELTDYYFGTQDNRIWSSNDEGISWFKKDGAPEGGGFSMLGRINNFDNTRITGYQCGNCYTFVSQRRFEHAGRWENPGHQKGSNPLVLRQRRYLQFGKDTIGPDVFKLFYSDDMDDNWEEIITIDQDLASGMKLSRSDQDWITFGIKDGSSKYKLRSISNVDNTDDARLNVIDGFGSTHLRGYGFEWTAVFGVDPINPNHIIVPDIESKVMKYSLDGGLSWNEDLALTEVLTNSGQFELYARGRGLLVNEISFHPNRPNHIMVGTKYNGIAITKDGGLSWKKLSLSEMIPHITSFYWDVPNGDVIVSSYGRGLWRLGLGENYLNEVPDVIRSPEATAAERMDTNPDPKLTDLYIDGGSSVNGFDFFTGSEQVTVHGEGFVVGQNRNYPVVISVNGKNVDKVIPNSKGGFSISISLNLPEGNHTVSAKQKTPDGLVEVNSAVMVTNIKLD